MQNQTINGKLKHWNADKGFGFIAAGGEVGDVFIHISILKHMNRAPKVGDEIYFQFEIQSDGKKKAVTARIAGVETVKTNHPPQKRQTNYHQASGKKSGGSRLIYALIVVSVIGVVGRYFNQEPSLYQQEPITIPVPNPHFRCEGKQHCSQMDSYEEALFYIRNCPDTKMDGDGDGEPCERQFNR